MRPTRPGWVTAAAASVLAAAGLALSSVGALEVKTSGETLERTLAETTSRARELDVIRHQARTERGAPASAAQLVATAVERATSQAERDALKRAGAATDAAAFDAALTQVDESQAARLAPAWQAAETARARLRLFLSAGTLLLLVALAIALGGRRGAARAADGTDELVDVLRARLDELYGARTRLGEDQRFAALGEIAAGLSHGLKTPLASVRAAAQAAQARLGADSPAAPQLEDIIRETDGLAEQVQRFLRLFKDMSVSFSAFTPGRLVELMVARYATDAAGRGITVQVAVDAATPQVRGDPALLELALRNVVENALLASGRGRTVTLGVRPTAAPDRAGLDQQPPAPGAWVEYSVDDEGEGLSSQAAHTPGDTTRETGSGLGLALTRRLVGRHGGAVVFETREGGGTRVRLLLPCAPPEGEAT